ncbi:MAG: alanine racemase [Cyclonatronaceae bacterium]
MKRILRNITAKQAATSFVEINLSHLRHNARLLAAKAGKSIKKMAVVKANAYGHGADIAGPALQDEACIDAFGVATVEEAINLRNAGVIKPILVFAPVKKHTVADYRMYSLVAVVGSLEELNLLTPSISFHLEFDTGMGRLGFYPEEWPQIYKHIEEKELKPTGIMTHFATADAPGAAYTREQLRRFKKLLSEMGEWAEGKIIHAANSGGLLYYEEEGVRFDMVRFGISLYGFSPNPEVSEQKTETRDDAVLKPVLQWKSCVTACRRITKGQSVSYEAIWQAPEDGWLLVLPVGYADGLRRGLSNRTYMSVEGLPEALPQVGNITMDYCMLFSKQEVATGTIVKIMGDGQPEPGFAPAPTADAWARELGSISYEILCGIHPKIERIETHGRASLRGG